MGSGPHHIRLDNFNYRIIKYIQASILDYNLILDILNLVIYITLAESVNAEVELKGYNSINDRYLAHEVEVD